MNLWLDNPKPIFCLAPMEGVTDSVFRQIVATIGKPAVMFTEFTSVEGIFSKGAESVKQRLQYTEVEKPLVAQLWGLRPENFYKAGQEVVKLGFDGVDLNFGCPERKVLKMGACAAMMKDRTLAKEVLQAIKEGVAGMIPVSIKTRIGDKKIETEDWAGFFLEQGVDALIIHGRTVKEMSDVPAHWDEIGNVVKLRNEMGKQTIIIGNGDVESLAEANAKVKRFGVDGVMIGRGVLKNPWVFKSQRLTVSSQERLKLLLKHVRLWNETWGQKRNFEELKKYFKIYIRDFAEAGEWRERLMDCRDLEEVEIVAKHLRGVSSQAGGARDG